MDSIQVLINLCVGIIPAIISYLVVRYQGKTDLKKQSKENKSEIERLIKQHQIDLESLKEKHKLEMESKDAEHRHKLEIMEKEQELLSKTQDQTTNANMTTGIADKVIESFMENPSGTIDALNGLEALAKMFPKEKSL